MAHIERSVVIDAPVFRVYAYASHIPRFTEWWPSLIEVRSYAQERPVAGLKYDWTYKMLGVKFEGTTEYVEVVPNQLLRWKNDAGIVSTFEARFEPAGAGKTRYTMAVDYLVPIKLLGRIADKLFIERHNEREAEHVLANLKAICEAEAKAADAGAPALARAGKR